MKRAAMGAVSALVLALAIVPAAVKAQADSTWKDHERALQAARQANDTVRYRAQLDAVYGIIGATPRVAARYASLAIDAHDSAGAARWMGALAAMGDELDTGLVSRYGALAGAGALRSLRATHAFATRDEGAPKLVTRLPDADMISEDLAYDPQGGRFLVSSVHHGGIYAIAHGRTTTLVKPGADSTWGMFALGVDRTRGVLWATTAAFSATAGYSPSDSGRSALVKYDLSTGALRGRYVAPDTGSHVLGDLVLGGSGAVYVSDGVGGGVYAIAPGQDSLRVLAARGTFRSPQTPALSSDGTTLFVSDYAIGIAAVDIESGRFTWVTHSDSLALTGIDGMYRVGADLIVVQNGLEPNRIVRLALDRSMRRVVRATTIARGASSRSLTHATVVGDWLYFLAKSGWERMADDGAMTAAASAVDRPAIMRVPLTR
ncbi:MAG TPA: hypothetical protein VGJ12_09890 [Gemmatimonadaceae bacterium]